MAGPLDPQAILKTGGLSGVFVADAPMSRLASEIYALLEPYAVVDATYNYALRTLCEALAKMYVDVDELVRESEVGDVGWSAILDPDRTPDEGLAWLGQITGTALRQGDPLAVSRARVKAAAGLRRGTVAQITLAAQQYLVGNKTVLISERTTDAWHLAIRTRTSETPDSVAVALAIVSQKPAGLIVDYATFTGKLFLESKAAQATYALSTAAFATYTLRGA